MNYRTEVLSQAAGPAIVLNEATRQYFRSFNGLEDAVIVQLLAEAADAIQTRLTRQLLTAVRRINLSCFPGQYGWQPLSITPPAGYPDFGVGDDPIHMPWPKLISVQSINYYDSSAVQQTFTDFDVDTIGDGIHGIIRPSRGERWPTVDLLQPVPAWIVFTCGYGDTQASLPPGLQLAIRALALFWHENREQGVGIPEHIEAAIDAYRTGRQN